MTTENDNRPVVLKLKNDPIHVGLLFQLDSLREVAYLINDLSSGGPLSHFAILEPTDPIAAEITKTQHIRSPRERPTERGRG